MPFGLRPIYYAETDRGWTWSFTLKELLPRLGTLSLDRLAIDEILIHRWLMDEHTLIIGVKQVLPSHFVCLRPGKPPLVRRYARVEFSPSPEQWDEVETIQRTNHALDAYFGKLRARHSRIAIFLSGGVDSSLLLAKARDYHFEKLVAVTAWFPGLDNPEADRARQVARHLEVKDHRMVPVTDSFIEEFFPELVRRLERPPAYINSFARAAMFQAIAGEVDAVVIGEGADGMFSDESAQVALRYDRKQRLLNKLPWNIRRGLAKLTPARLRYILANSTFDMVRGSRPFYAAYEPAGDSITAFCQTRNLYTSNRNQYYTYAKLADVHGIKIEFPFLMQGLTEIGLILPDKLKADHLGAKPILKKLACRYLPEEWMYASKLGFHAPLASWLSGPLGNWRSDLLEQLINRGMTCSANDHFATWAMMGLGMFCRLFVDQESELDHVSAAASTLHSA